MTPDLLDHALRAHRAGVCVFPPKEDGSKRPDTNEWKSRQTTRTTEAELRQFYANGRTGLGVITGAVSGSLEMLDFDERTKFTAFCERALTCGLGELVKRIIDGYLERTPRGVHTFYRCTEIAGNTPLARREKQPEERKHEHDRILTMIETRGEGGFGIVAPSFGAVHNSGIPYKLTRGGFESIVTISPDEREALHDLARSFDEMRREKPAQSAPDSKSARSNGELRPGDDFNARATWPEILEPHGWRNIFDRDGESYWCRPGKPFGISATSNYRGSDLLFVFSTSTPFEPERSYSKFGAYTVLEHAGDFNAATRALAAKGYGQSAPPPPPPPQADPAICESVDPREFFDEHGFVAARAGSLLKSESHLALGEDDRLYRYSGGVYVGDGEQRARARLRELLGDKFKRRHLDEVIAWLRSEAATIPARPPATLLNVANGVLDWRTGEMRPHSPEFRCAIQIPIEWHPHSCCPQIEKFLEDVLPDEDTLQLVLEIIGYALLASLSLHTAVLLLGPGRNGKSVLLAILRALLGAVNVASVPLQLFSESRFAAAMLYGKLANICGDLDARAIERTDIFKMMTGGDAIFAERKYGQPFAFTSFALPIFSANEAPYSRDQSDAWFERWIVIPMAKVIPPGRRDPDLAAKLTSQSELEGLLVMAVEALRRLMERGRFEIPKAVSEAGREYREELDSVAGWLADRCTLDPEAVTPRTKLFASYRTWCEDNGHRFPLRAAALYARLRQHPELVRTAHDGVREFQGVKIR